MKDLSERTLSLFSDSTRDKLLKKSLELFNKKGYVSVTTSLQHHLPMCVKEIFGITSNQKRI